MDYLPLRTSKMSIKARLTLWFTLVAFLLVLIVQGFMLIVNGNAVVDDADALLVSEVQANMKKVDERGGRIDVNDVDAFKNGVYTSVYSAAGKFLSGAVPFETDEPFRAGVTRPVTVSGREYILYDMFVPLDTGGVWVRGITGAETAETLLQTVLDLSMFTLPLVLVLAAVGGYLTARGALKPIRQITEAANAINDGNDLSRRIGLGKPGSHDELQKLSDTFDNMFARLENPSTPSSSSPPTSPTSCARPLPSSWRSATTPASTPGPRRITAPRWRWCPGRPEKCPGWWRAC